MITCSPRRPKQPSQWNHCSSNRCILKELRNDALKLSIEIPILHVLWVGWGWLLWLLHVLWVVVGMVIMVIACSVGGVRIVIMVIGRCILLCDFIRLTMNSWL